VTLDEADWRDFFSSTGGTATLSTGSKSQFTIAGLGKSAHPPAYDSRLLSC
jgi:hypothetical protein